MKKLIYCAAALVTALFAGSCQQELLDTAQSGSTVTYTVEMPQVATKAVGEADSVNNLVYAVYRVIDNTNLSDKEAKENLATNSRNYQLMYQEDTPVVKDNQSGKKLAHISLELINDQRYVVIFWAQKGYTWFKKGDPFTTVTYPATLDGNNDAYDAFTNVDVISVDGSFSKDITLVRPFAQLNIATVVPGPTQEYPNRYTDFKVSTTAVEVDGVARSFNVGAQVGESEGKVDFAAAAPISQEFNATYPAYLSMNYVFVLANQSNVKVSYDINTNKYGTVENTVPNVPIARNYRTNIIGNLLTSDVDYNVELAPWAENSNTGTTEVIVDGLVKNQKGDYEVINENGLSWAMNNLFKENANYYLTQEVYNLSGFAVTPPVVPTGVTINIYGETPVVTRAATTFAGITIIGLPVVDGTPTLIAEVENGGSVSVSGVTLDDEGSVLVENNQGTLVVTETEVKSDSYVGEGSKEPVQADSVSTLNDLQTSLASGVKQINLASPITIPAGDEVVINLNGKTVIGVDDYETGSYGLITNNGTLIVEGPGTIQLNATNDRDWNAYSSVISNQRGTLTVNEGVVIEHLGGTDMAYGIDNLTNGDEKDAVTIVNGATVKSTYRAIRQFLNSPNADNELYVYEGSEIIGENKSIWSQNANSGANPGKTVVVADAKLTGDVMLSASGATEWPVEVSIAASALVSPSTVVPSNVLEYYSVIEENGVWTVKTNEAKVGDVTYLSFAKAVAEAKAGDTITMLSDVILSESLTLPAGITFNGNGKQINGTISAGGNLTFAGHTKATSFSAGYYNRTITIGEGACLEVTGTGRVTLGYGNTFNITGNIDDAKTADKANVQPSLIIPGGMSITGSYREPTTMNVVDAYVQIGSTSSKDSAANGEFNINFTNSIAEFTNQFTFAEPKNGNTPTFNVNIINSTLTTETKLIAAAPGCNVKVDNSNVTLKTYFRNSGKFDVVNGSKLTGATIQFGENGGNDGALTVDASTVIITASSTGYALDGKGTGSITLKNAAEVTIDYVKDMILAVADGCTFTFTELLGNCSNRTVVADGVTKDENGAYYVSSAAGLEKMNQMFSGKTAGRDVVLNLTEDIDFTGKTWTPVDSHVDFGFCISEINGNGHTISNLTINGQAMFTRFSGSGDVTVKNITFDNATVDSNGSINTSILVGHTYQNVLLDNVDVKNSTIIGGYKVAPLIATVYNESTSTITATLKNCDVENTTVKATSYDFCTTGMVAFVYAGDNDNVAFENCTVSDVKLYAPNVYTAHAAIYTTGSETLFNEAEGVTVSKVTFENI